MSRTQLLRNALLALVAACALALAFAAQAQNPSSDYRLGEGDGIRISVFQNPDLTLETRVSESGMITFPLTGAIKVGGLTISAAEQAIAAALKSGGYIQQPQVSILLLRNLGNQVSVLGQVNKPGRFPLETFSTRLSEMLSIAGGIAPTGADTAIVTGTRDGQSFRTEVDVARMFLDSKLKDDMVVAGGDVIYIPHQPMFYVYGEVQRPGSYRVERNMTVRQALAQSGGLTGRGSERSVSVFRRGTDGAMQRLSPGLDEPVQADDVLQVRESIF
jgi:polysaccharide export outer membrane protein